MLLQRKRCVTNVLPCLVRQCVLQLMPGSSACHCFPQPRHGGSPNLAAPDSSWLSLVPKLPQMPPNSPPNPSAAPGSSSPQHICTFFELIDNCFPHRLMPGAQAQVPFCAVESRMHLQSTASHSSEIVKALQNSILMTPAQLSVYEEEGPDFGLCGEFRTNERGGAGSLVDCKFV